MICLVRQNKELGLLSVVNKRRERIDRLSSCGFYVA